MQAMTAGNILQYVEEEEYMGRPRNASGINTADLCCDQNRLEENNFSNFFKASYVDFSYEII